jgi:hypothetical protein
MRAGLPRVRALGAMSLLLAMLASPVAAAERYAVVVTSPSGEAEFVDRFDQWRTTFVTLLRQRLGYPEDHIFVLAEEASFGVRSATGQQVRVVLDQIRQRAVPGDVVLVLLMGHGSIFEGDDAKFNLVGPDLTVDEWASLVKPIAGRVVFVNGTAGSAPFLRKLAGRDRIVVTATDTVAQRYATVFPEFFVRAFDDTAADADKNARVSIWEAFEYASARVKDWFGEQGRPATERALLDDTGDGVGREAGELGADGALARETYLQRDGAGAVTGGPELERLMRRRKDLESQMAILNAGRSKLPPEKFESDLERLLLEIAEIDREIRSKS